MRKNLVLTSTILLALMITAIALMSYFKKREQYKALRKPTQNDTKQFLEIVNIFKQGKQEGIVAAQLRIGADELKYLEGIGDIPYLNFYRTTIKNSDMELIAKIPGLTALDLTETRITDEGLKYLEKHPTLKVLWLNHIPISDEGLKSIATIPHLEELHLWMTNTTDAGCVTLAKIQTLKILSLEVTMVTDRGVRTLFPLKNLIELKTWNSKVSDAGRKAIRANWPKIKLDGKFADDEKEITTVGNSL